MSNIISLIDLLLKIGFAVEIVDKLHTAIKDAQAGFSEAKDKFSDFIEKCWDISDFIDEAKYNRLSNRVREAGSYNDMTKIAKEINNTSLFMKIYEEHYNKAWGYKAKKYIKKIIFGDEWIKSMKDAQNRFSNSTLTYHIAFFMIKNDFYIPQDFLVDEFAYKLQYAMEMFGVDKKIYNFDEDNRGRLLFDSNKDLDIKALRDSYKIIYSNLFEANDNKNQEKTISMFPPKSMFLPEEQLRSICQHRDMNGHWMFDDSGELGIIKCKVCGKTFNVCKEA